jgi:Do/DeqQ family serine protease
MKTPSALLLLATLAAASGCRDDQKARASPAQIATPLQPAAEESRPPGAPTVEAPPPSADEGLELLTKLDREGRMGHRTFAALFQLVSRSVVNIFTSRTVRRMAQDPGSEDLSRYEHFFGSQAREHLQKSLGSGFIIDRKGHILTNDHVIEDAEEIRVRTWSGRESEAKVVGRDPKTDLAIIKVPASRDLVPVVLGDSDRVAIGDWVAAIGNPFGLSHTMTVGVVSAKGRKSRAGEMYNLIQTDATINPGNSGGPLLSLKGEVIGVNTSIAVLGKGIGFAIPINAAKEVIPHLKLKGRVVRPWLGIYHQAVTPELALSFGLKRPQGALVAGVVDDSPAARAGIKQGDIILRFDGKSIRDNDDLRFVVYRLPVGKSVKVVVHRDRQAYELRMTLEAEPEEPKLALEPTPRGPRVLGLTLVGAGGEEGLGGVIVQAVQEGSIAWEAGLRPDDLILAINDVPIADLESYRAVYRRLKQGDVCRLKLRRRGIEQFVAFRVVPE